jgi:hypothetical protein
MRVDWKVAQIHALWHNNSIGEEAKEYFLKIFYGFTDN